MKWIILDTVDDLYYSGEMNRIAQFSPSIYDSRLMDNERQAKLVAQDLRYTGRTLAVTPISFRKG
jgi:hypothetical protein